MSTKIKFVRETGLKYNQPIKAASWEVFSDSDGDGRVDNYEKCEHGECATYRGKAAEQAWNRLGLGSLGHFVRKHLNEENSVVRGVLRKERFGPEEAPLALLAGHVAPKPGREYRLLDESARIYAGGEKKEIHLSMIDTDGDISRPDMIEMKIHPYYKKFSPSGKYSIRRPSPVAETEIRVELDHKTVASIGIKGLAKKFLATWNKLMGSVSKPVERKKVKSAG